MKFRGNKGKYGREMKGYVGGKRRFFLFNNIIFNTILQDNTVSKQLRDIAYSSLGETSSSWNSSLLVTSCT